MPRGFKHFLKNAVPASAASDGSRDAATNQYEGQLMVVAGLSLNESLTGLIAEDGTSTTGNLYLN